MTDKILLLVTILCSVVIDCILENYTVKPKYFAPIVSSIPTIVVTVLISIRVSFSQIIVAILDNATVFAVLLVFLSLIPAAAGLLVDLPIGLMQYAKRNGLPMKSVKQLSRQDKINIAENGDIHGIVTGCGRVNVKKDHLKYFLMCNMTGVTPAVLLLLTVASIDGISEEIMMSNVLGFNIYDGLELVICGTIGYLLVFVSDQQNKAYGIYENPDNYNLSRVHQLCNFIYLFISQSVSYIFALLIVIYEARNIRSCSSIVTHILLSLTILSLLLFLYISGKSEYAETIEAQAEVFWKFTPYALAAVYVAVSCFLFQMTEFHIMITIATGMLVCTVRYMVKPHKGNWYVLFPFIIMALVAIAIISIIPRRG